MTDTTTTPPALALDLTYGDRGPETCGICGTGMPAVDKPIFELETADTAKPLCRACAHRTHAPLAAAIVFLTALTRAYENGDTAKVGEGVRAILDGMDMWHAETGTPIPMLAPEKPHRTRYAPGRRTRKKH